MEVLQKFTFNKQTEVFEAEIVKAQAEVAEKQRDYQAAKSALDKLDRQLADSAFIDYETKTIVQLDDVIRFFEEDKAADARPKLEEAKKLWTEAQDRRANARFDELKARIRDAAKKPR